MEKILCKTNNDLKKITIGKKIYVPVEIGDSILAVRTTYEALKEAREDYLKETGKVLQILVTDHGEYVKTVLLSPELYNAYKAMQN